VSKAADVVGVYIAAQCGFQEKRLGELPEQLRRSQVLVT
jgi:hypothetical protein